jgi:hypothetical protein
MCVFGTEKYLGTKRELGHSSFNHIPAQARVLDPEGRAFIA